MRNGSLSAVLLVCLCSSVFSLQDTSAESTLTEMLDEMEITMERQSELLTTLETNNQEQSELLIELKKSLEKQQMLSTSFGQLLEDNIAYSKRLERGRNFWRIITGALAVSLATTIVVTRGNK